MQNKISIQEIANRILRGGTLEDKLFGATLSSSEIEWTQVEWTDQDRLNALVHPGRSGKLSPRSGEEDSFPKASELKNESARGKLLHYFANHELLAMESMALTILKFPDAPLSFQQGVFKTLQDEQRHFGAYQLRMQDYGVALGDFPLNLYFWNTLKTIESPLDFVVRMSMTFEQANLDFALEFARQMESLGDEKCAALLRVVHDDEVKHVQHGLKWFNEWRTGGAVTQTESEWEAYKRLLPFPMTPRRAKGKWFSAQSRIDAGFSKDYIDELKISGGSRGRAPDYYFFNPQCESEPQELTLAAKQKIEDLAPLIIWLGKESDLVEITKRPPREFLAEVHALKGELPEIIIPGAEQNYSAFENFKPWGWSASALSRYQTIENKVRSKPMFFSEAKSEVFPWLSKSWWSEKIALHPVLLELVPKKTVVQSADDLKHLFLENPGEQFILKQAKGMGGRGHLVVNKANLNQIKFSDGIQYVAERYFTKLADFSVQFDILSSGELKIFEPRFFKNTEKFQYEGAYLGSGVREEIPQKFWDAVKKSGEDRFKIVRGVAEVLKNINYVGPVGIDCLLYEDQDTIRVHPLLEVNARTTMGRVALELEAVLRKNAQPTNRHWRFYIKSDLKKLGAKNFEELKWIVKKDYPNLIETTPAITSKETWTVIL